MIFDPILLQKYRLMYLKLRAITGPSRYYILNIIKNKVKRIAKAGPAIKTAGESFMFKFLILVIPITNGNKGIKYGRSGFAFLLRATK